MLYSRKISVIVLLIYIQLPQASGQQNKIYNNMSLDELLNIDVAVTASKKPEDLFETPLSVTIIKKEEISKSGATSIPEALRLSPGLIVREITPGNFDVQIRGFDDITKNAYLTLPYNTTTLVMIDNRIVYSYFTGGTFWETFPVDLNDIERIEVVRGPVSALYGPNAATGVINIITSHAARNGMNISANGSAGNHRYKNASANIGYNWNDKTKLSFSGNITERRRFNVEYFDYTTQSYTSIDNQNMLLWSAKDETSTEIWKFKDFQKSLDAWYDEDISLQKFGGNVFFYHSFSEQSIVDISLGGQNSQSQKTGFLNFATALSQVNSSSYYVSSRIKHKNFNGQFNMNTGQDLSNYKFNSLKYTNIEANLEYYIQLNEFSFRPGMSYKHSSYNSPITYVEPFSLTKLNYQYKDESRTMESYAASLLTEWKPTPKLRLIVAARVDKFNINENYSVNYEFASTYRINKNNLVRFVYSKANRSPFIFDTYLNCNFKLNMPFQTEYNKVPIVVPIRINILANKNLKLPSFQSHEICWRTKLKSNLNLDIELYYSTARNFIVSDVYRESHMIQQLNPLNEVDSINSISGDADVIFENFDLKAKQFGASFMLTYNVSDQFSTKLYGTYQKTGLSGRTEIEFNINNINLIDNKEDRTRSIDIKSFTNPTQWSEKLTPSFYGGFYVNYKPGDSWNFSTDAYVYTSQRFIDYDYNNILSDYSGKFTNYHMDINAGMVLNAKVSYRLNKHATAYGTVKNIFGSHREFGYADQIGTLALIGLQLEL
jgi:iron complex outermembrane receptor protein